MDNSWIKRIAVSALVVFVIILIYTEIFLWGILYFENKPVTFAQSLQVVIESLTTSGYGGFAPWQSDFMNYFILFMNITGVLIVGYGLSGQAAAAFLKEKKVDVKILDVKDKNGVDIIGDIRDTDTLKSAALDDISAMIITIQDDTMAIFATLIARSLNKKIYIIVRANKKENIKNNFT